MSVGSHETTEFDCNFFACVFLLISCWFLDMFLINIFTTSFGTCQIWEGWQNPTRGAVVVNIG
jgi:hypothetical protein